MRTFYGCDAVYLREMGREALKYLAGIAAVCLLGLLITVCTSGCAVVSPVGYVAFTDQPAYAYRVPVRHHHHRGRPVMVRKPIRLVHSNCAVVRTVYKNGRSVTRCVR